MTLRAWVQRRVVGGDVYVLATTAYHARVRVNSLTSIRKPVVEEVEEAASQKFRCGIVGVEVVWVPPLRQFLTCVTTRGTRHFVDAEHDGGVLVDSDYVDAARTALQTLVDAEDLDEGVMLWERVGGDDGGDRPHVTRAP